MYGVEAGEPQGHQIVLLDDSLQQDATDGGDGEAMVMDDNSAKRKSPEYWLEQLTPRKVWGYGRTFF